MARMLAIITSIKHSRDLGRHSKQEKERLVKERENFFYPK